MSQRFFSATPISGSKCTIDGTEAHHMLHVMRAQVGDQVTLFDNSGQEFLAALVKTSRKDVELEILSSSTVDRELSHVVVLAVALPKGDRQKWLVEKLTELGVRQLVPLQTEHGVAQPTGKALERLGRSVIEASKQCRRNRLLEITPPCQLEDLVRSGGSAVGSPAGLGDNPRRWIAHPYDETDQRVALQDFTPSTSHTGTIALVGPEGGFSTGEAALAREHGWQPVDLGRRILRIETAAVALAALLATHG